MTSFTRISALCVSFFALICVSCMRDPAKKEATFLERGKKLLEQKDYARAALEFRSANQASPRDAEPLYQLGSPILARISRIIRLSP